MSDIKKVIEARLTAIEVGANDVLGYYYAIQDNGIWQEEDSIQKILSYTVLEGLDRVEEEIKSSLSMSGHYGADYPMTSQERNIAELMIKEAIEKARFALHDHPDFLKWKTLQSIHKMYGAPYIDPETGKKIFCNS